MCKRYVKCLHVTSLHPIIITFVHPCHASVAFPFITDFPCLYHVLSCYVIPHHIIFYLVITRHIISYHIISYHITLDHIISYYTVFRTHGDAPEVTIHGRTDLHFPYAPSHIRYILLYYILFFLYFPSSIQYYSVLPFFYTSPYRHYHYH